MATAYASSSDEPDIVYYNVSVVNGRTIYNGAGTQVDAKYTETRDSPVIRDASKYFFSIVRASLSGTDKFTPLFIPRVEIGQADRNKTIYNITLRVVAVSGGKSATFTSTRPISWTPQMASVVVPPAPLTSQDFSNEYYWCMNYEWWVDLVNDTFQACWNDLNTSYKTFSGGFNLTTPQPYIRYDPSTKRFSLYGSTYGWGGADRQAPAPSDENFSMYFDSNMYGLFSFFPHRNLGGDPATTNSLGVNKCAYEILFFAKQPGANIYRPTTIASATPTASPTFYVMEQDMVSTTTLWSPIDALVFTTTLIPIVNEQSGQPVFIGQSNSTGIAGGGSFFQPIITDVQVAMDSGTGAEGYNEQVSYVPSAEYRLTAMSNTKVDVRNIDIQVFWRNRLDGQLYPIKMFNQASFSLKIMFRRRDFNITY